MAGSGTVISYVYWYSDDPSPPELRDLSPNVQDVFGYTLREWQTDRHLWQRLLHPEDAEAAIAATWRTTFDHVPYDVTYRMVTRDSRFVWIHDRAEVEVDEIEKGELWRGTWTVIPEPPE